MSESHGNSCWPTDSLVEVERDDVIGGNGDQPITLPAVGVGLGVLRREDESAWAGQVPPAGRWRQETRAHTHTHTHMHTRTHTQTQHPSADPPLDKIRGREEKEAEEDMKGRTYRDIRVVGERGSRERETER